MESPNPRQVRHYLFAARAVHDDNFRDLLRNFGISPDGSLKDVRDRLATMDDREFQELVSRIDDADLTDPQAARAQLVLSELDELSRNLWVRERDALSQEAKKVMEGPVVEARRQLARGNLDAFHEKQAEISDQVGKFSAAIREAQNRVGDEMRQFLYAAPADISKADRKKIIEEKKLEHVIPRDIQEVLALENTLAQEEVEFVMRQDQQNRPAPEATPSPNR